MPVLVALVVLAAAVAGCGDDAGDNSEPTVPEIDAIDRDSAAERSVEVCRRSSAGAAGVVCEELAATIVDEAIAAECPTRSLDAYLEHAVAWRFDDLPVDGFFDRCPAPLSSLAIEAPPDAFAAAVTTEPEQELLVTEEVAADYVGAEAVGRFLDQVGHEVSYRRRWWRDDTMSWSVRLDRFATVEAADQWVEPTEHENETPASSLVGAVHGRFVPDTGTAGDGGRIVATGRVCEVAITVVVDGDSGTDDDLVAVWFEAQAARVAAASTC